MCGNGEKPCGVRLAPQRCFEANRRLRRLLGRDIPYAVPSVKALKLLSFGAFSFLGIPEIKTACVHKKVHKPFIFFADAYSKRQTERAYLLPSRSCFILRK